jgi:hypothetical protein
MLVNHYIIMAQSTLRAKGSSVRDRRQRPTQTRQRMRTDKIEDMQESLNYYAQETQNHCKDDLLKMETQYNLETHYIALQSKNDKIDDIEISLEKLSEALIKTRSHISRAKLISAKWQAYRLDTYFETGTIPHADMIRAKNHENPPKVIRTLDSDGRKIRKLTVAIYIARYENTKKTAKMLKIMQSDYESELCEGQGIVSEVLSMGWNAFTSTIKAYASYATHYFQKNVKLPIIVESMKNFVIQVKNYIEEALAKLIARVSLKTISYIILTIVVLGLVSSTTYYLFKQIILSLYNGVPLTSVDFDTVAGQGDEPVGVCKGNSIFTMIGQIVSTSIDGTYNFKGDQFLAKFGNMASRYTSIERCLKSVWGHLRTMSAYAYQKITGDILFDVDKVPQEVEKHCLSLQEARKLFNKSQRFVTKEEAENIIESADYLKKMVAMRLNTTYPTLSATITTTLLHCCDLIDAATSFLYGAHFRVMPVWVHLVGLPGVGKTWLINSLISYCKHYYGKNYNNHNIRYDRKINNEYWEGYAHQFAMAIDDWMQDKDMEARKEAALEMIYAVNNNPHHLHFAGMADKKGQFFDSPFVFTTSNYSANRYLPEDINIVDTQALYRRMQVKYRVIKTQAFIDNPEIEGKDPLDTLNLKFIFTAIDDKGRLSEHITFTGLLARIGAQYRKNLKDFEMSKANDDPNVLEQLDRIFEGKQAHFSVDENGTYFNKDGKKSICENYKLADRLNDHPTLKPAIIETLPDDEEEEKGIAPLVKGQCWKCRLYVKEGIQCRCPEDKFCYFHDDCACERGADNCPIHWENVCHCPHYCFQHSPRWIMTPTGLKMDRPHVGERPAYVCPRVWNNIMRRRERPANIVGQGDDDEIEEEEDNLDSTTSLDKRYDTLKTLKDLAKGNTSKSSYQLLGESHYIYAYSDKTQSEKVNYMKFKDNPIQFIFDGLQRTCSDEERLLNTTYNSLPENTHLLTAVLDNNVKKNIKLGDIHWKEYFSGNLFDTHEMTRNQLVHPYGKWIDNLTSRIKEDFPDQKVMARSLAMQDVCSKILAYMEDILCHRVEEPNPIITEHLNQFVWDHDVRARKWTRKIEWFVSMEIVYEYPLVDRYPFWKNQCLFQWVYPTSAGIRLDKKQMKKIELHDSSWMAVLTGAHSTRSFKTTNFPGSDGKLYDTKWYSDNNQILPICHDQAQMDKLQKARKALAIAGAVMITALLGTVIVLVTKAVIHFFHRDEDVIGQSFDKNTEKKANKQLKKQRPQKGRLPTKKVEGEIGTRNYGTLAKGQSDVVGHSNMVSLGVTFAHNTEYIAFETATGELHYAFCTILRSNVCAVASHVFKTNKIVKVIFMWAKIKNTMEYHLLENEHYTIKHVGSDRDLSYLILKPGLLPAYRDITNHLMTKEEWTSFTDIPNISKVTFADDSTLMVLNCNSAELTHNTKVSYSGQINEFSRLWFIRDMPNEAGHCGYPIYTTNSKFQKKLLGIHTGGVALGSYFSPIFLDDLKDVVEGQALGPLVPEAIYLGSTLKKYDIKIEPTVGFGYAGLRLVGTLLRDNKPFNYWIPNRTALMPTGILGGLMRIDQVPFTTKNPYLREAMLEKKTPAALAPCKKQMENGEMMTVLPLDNAMSKFEGRNKPPQLNTYKRKYFDGIVHKNFDFGKLRPLTDDEVINGVKGSNFIGPVDLAASAATGLAEFGITMKDIIIGPDGKRKLTADYQQLLDYRQLNYYDKNLVPPFLGTGTLKDELRTLLKKYYPRLFINGAKASLFEAKKWFARLFEQVVNHNGEGDVYIGINPHSRSWKDLYLKLKSKSSTKIIADDIAKWDLMMAAEEFIREFEILCSEENISKDYIRMWKLILESILTPYIIIGDKIYKSIQMPSGSYLTAMINSMFNSWMLRKLWDVAFPDKNFDEYIAQAIFGDDVVQAVSDKLDNSLWNGQVVAELRKKYFGMDTTSIFKDGRSVPKFMNLETVQGENSAQFIKRQFRVENDNVYPVLDFNSIVGMIEWIRPDEKQGRTDKICMKDNIETALREMVYYGEEEFNNLYNYVKPIYQECKWGDIPVKYDSELLKYLEN